MRWTDMGAAAVAYESTAIAKIGISGLTMAKLVCHIRLCTRRYTKPTPVPTGFAIDSKQKLFRFKVPAAQYREYFDRLDAPYVVRLRVIVTEVHAKAHLCSLTRASRTRDGYGREYVCYRKLCSLTA